MKKMTIRNFVLSKNKRQAFYKGKEIINCGLMGKPKYYWIELETGETIELYMAETIQTY